MAVAQRMYARALFEAAREAGRVDAVSADLGAIAGAMDEVPELRAFLRNPQIEPAGKADVLAQLSAGGDELVVHALDETALVLVGNAPRNQLERRLCDCGERRSGEGRVGRVSVGFLDGAAEHLRDLLRGDEERSLEIRVPRDERPIAGKERLEPVAGPPRFGEVRPGRIAWRRRVEGEVGNDPRYVPLKLGQRWRDRVDRRQIVGGIGVDHQRDIRPDRLIY